MLASAKFGLHWPTRSRSSRSSWSRRRSLGLLVALPSRRLVGDYLAIVTLFFGQLFVTVANNGNRHLDPRLDPRLRHHGRPERDPDIDPFHLFGHCLESVQSYYYVALVVLPRRARRDLPRQRLAHRPRLAVAARGLARRRADGDAGQPAEARRVRLRRGVAGLTGTLFASLNTGRLRRRLRHAAADHVYAMLILGGAGSLGGVILGALVVNVSLEVLRTPNHATLGLLRSLIVATLVAKLRPWRWLAGVLVGTIAFGFAVHAIVTAIWPSANDGDARRSAASSATRARALGAAPDRPDGRSATGPSSRSSSLVLVLTTAHGLAARNSLLIPTLYLAAFVWETRLAAEPSITRLILIGVILIVLMNARPQGLLGTRGWRSSDGALLELRGVSKRFGGLRVHRRARPARRRARDRQRDRPERRRQDDALQPDHRRLRARRGRHPASPARACSGSSRTRSRRAGSRARSRRCGCS